MSKTNYKRVAVTGSTGMLGSHLVAELLRRGYGDVVLPVRSLARLGALEATLRRERLLSGAPENECEKLGIPCGVASLPALHPVEVALNDPNGLREAFAGVDAVFHCAAAVSLGDDDAQELIETNVEMTEHVVDAAIACRVRRLVHTSSVAALGEARPGETLIDESCELENISGTAPYGVSKFFSENRASRGVLQGLEVVIVNPGIILGAG
ncbi:MAG: NAD-dependent epimerase/dehydratase family protein, partial [Rikenellaceae bacterium]|nr:NAD-dependent epimerase/dehydratase family protein [Rikenellaceae bacterium]